MNDRFGKDKIKKGLFYFFGGKCVSALAGFTSIILIVQGLSIRDFADYSVLVALVEIFTAISGVGLLHVMLRYVPELYASYQTTTLRKLVIGAITIRTIILAALLLICWAASGPISNLLKLGSAVTSFQLFLVVVGFRATSHFISQILESALHQGWVQASFASAVLLKCLLLYYLLTHGHISLNNVISAELANDVIACVGLFIGTTILLSQHRSFSNNDDEKNWFLNNRSQLTRFGITAYLQHLATLPFGGNTNRLVGGTMFGDKVMASFGYAQSLYEYAKRYLPTQLLIGLIRPIVVARYTHTKNFKEAAELCESALQVNIVLIVGMLAILIVAGPEILSVVSAGKYASESALLLFILLILLALETQRVILEVLTQTVNRYEILIKNNVFLSLSVLLGIAGYKFLGAVAFPIANAIALIIGNYRISKILEALGYRYSHDVNATITSIVILIFSAGIGMLFKEFGMHWMLSAFITSLTFLILVYIFKLTAVLSFVRELIGSKPVRNNPIKVHLKEQGE